MECNIPQYPQSHELGRCGHSQCCYCCCACRSVCVIVSVCVCVCERERETEREICAGFNALFYDHVTGSYNPT
uniref:Uncharacterized protein n=1 Tax=Anguilla anguilla TaxID=7936 RepID=A0A0E9WN65_ANGAN